MIQNRFGLLFRPDQLVFEVAHCDFIPGAEFGKRQIDHDARS